MELIKPGTKIDFVGSMKWAALGSFIATSIAVIFWFVIGPNFGLDFLGGTEVEVTFLQNQDISKVRQAIEGLNLGNTEIKRLGSEGNPYSSYVVRVQAENTEVTGPGGQKADVAQIVAKALEEKVGPFDKDKLRTSIVGPRAGKELRNKAFTAVMMSLILMLVYIWIRFDVISGVGAIISLFHDVTFVMGFLLIAHAEFSLSTIAALLTITGYSINDTIVIYDRIRESAKKYRALPFIERINLAINETLSRTILTSSVTLLAVIALAIVTRGAVQEFAFAMSIGIVVGTYSSIFIASAFVVFWHLKIEPIMAKSKKKAARQATK